MPGKIFADNTPSFPSCTNPQGTIIANNQTGVHGVAGDPTTYTGSDVVYSQGNNQVQCLCTGQTGIQTNWLNASDLSQNEISSLEAQGWIYIPTGLNWGLTDAPYLAQNISLSCSGGSANGTNNNDGPSNQSTLAPVCNDQTPGGAPVITSIVDGENSVTLTWTKSPNPVTSYLIAYGTSSGNYQFGDPYVGDANTTTFTINGLSGGQTYYFVVRAQNGCQPGPFSNEVTNTPSGPQLLGPAQGFSSNVLGATDPKTDSITFAKSLCASCFWWPVLLGEIILLAAFYLFHRFKKLKVNKLVFGGIIAVGAYIVFLIINKGHVCPDGSITLWLFSIPCRYFWLIDGVVLALLTWVFRNPTKPVTSKAKK